MIEYSTIKFGYSAGGDFSLSGADYFGYYYKIGNDAFTGIELTDQSQALTPNNTLNSDLFFSSFFKDRLISDALTLPYQLDQDLLIPVGEVCTQKIINDRLFKLYSNTVYLFSKTFLASNDIPVGYNRAAGVDKGTNQLVWTPQSPTDGTSFYPFASAGYSFLDDIIQIRALRYAEGSGFLFIGMTSSGIATLSSDTTLTTFNVIDYDTYVDNNSDLQFTKLSCFSVNGNDLFISDVGTNNIYKYNISGLLLDDISLAGQKFLTTQIGGKGSALIPTKFDNPAVIFAGPNDRVYVFDERNHCIKVFDSNLNYLSTKTFSAGEEKSVKCFAYNRTIKKIYIIIKDLIDGINHLWICSDDLDIIEDIIILDVLDASEEFKSIEFSTNDSNIMYMMTNRSVFKKFVNRPTQTIGKWLFYRSGTLSTHIWGLELSKYSTASWAWNEGTQGIRDNLEILGLNCFFQPNADYEEIFLFTGANGKSFNRILHYNETNTYNSVISVSNLNSYNVADSGVDVSEFVCGHVINKEFYKIAYNTLIITTYLYGKFTAEYDYYNNLVYKSIDPLDDTQFIKINDFELNDMYVHENESVSNSGVINRSISKLYNLQANALQATQTDVKNFVASLSGTRTIVLI